jgi:hypothetical protein
MLKGFGRVALAGGLLAIGVAAALPLMADNAQALEERAPKYLLGEDIEWINAPDQDQPADLKGRVVLIDLWGIN